MPTFDPADLSPDATYHLLSALVVPRPIAWVGSIGRDGVANLAPHSFFNVVSNDPPIVHFTSSGTKDTLTNIRAHPEFTVSLVTSDLLAAMNTTAVAAPPGEDEFALAGLEPAESVTVAPPRVAASPAALECTVRTVLSMGSGHMVFGDVTHLHVDDAVWRDGRVDHEVLAPVGRLSGSRYAMPGTIRELERPSWADLEAGTS